MITTRTHRVIHTPVLHGKNNTWEAPVSAWQADNASAPFEAPAEPWWHSLLLWIAIFAIAYLALRIFA
jgi:hypothetical protein